MVSDELQQFYDSLYQPFMLRQKQQFHHRHEDALIATVMVALELWKVCTLWLFFSSINLYFLIKVVMVKEHQQQNRPELCVRRSERLRLSNRIKYSNILSISINNNAVTTLVIGNDISNRVKTEES